MSSRPESRWRRLGGVVLAVVAGLLPLPIAFVAAFADVPPGELNPALHLSLRAGVVLWFYVILGALFGFNAPERAWRWGVWLWLPFGVLATAFSLFAVLSPFVPFVRASVAVAIPALVLVLTVSAATLGGVLGTAPRGRWVRFVLMLAVVLAVLLAIVWPLVLSVRQ